VKTGVQTFCKGSKKLDSGPRFSPGQVSFSRNDEKPRYCAFYELIKIRYREE